MDPLRITHNAIVGSNTWIFRLRDLKYIHQWESLQECMLFMFAIFILCSIPHFLANPFNVLGHISEYGWLG